MTTQAHISTINFPTTSSGLARNNRLLLGPRSENFDRLNPKNNQHTRRSPRISTAMHRFERVFSPRTLTIRLRPVDVNRPVLVKMVSAPSNAFVDSSGSIISSWSIERSKLQVYMRSVQSAKEPSSVNMSARLCHRTRLLSPRIHWYWLNISWSMPVGWAISLDSLVIQRHRTVSSKNGGSMVYRGCACSLLEQSRRVTNWPTTIPILSSMETVLSDRVSVEESRRNRWRSKNWPKRRRASFERRRFFCNVIFDGSKRNACVNNETNNSSWNNHRWSSSRRITIIRLVSTKRRLPDTPTHWPIEVNNPLLTSLFDLE